MEHLCGSEMVMEQPTPKSKRALLFIASTPALRRGTVANSHPSWIKSHAH